MTTAESYSIVILAFNAREWLSGGAPPCQGGGRGFDPRLALLFFLRGIQCIPLLLFCSHDVYRTRAGSMSRLLARSLLLLRRGVQRTPATRLALFLTFLGVFCVCTYIYIWKILKLKHFPKKLIPYIKIGY